MTREEAIEVLRDINMRFVPTDQYGDYADPQPYDDAIDMAIEALNEADKREQYGQNYEADDFVKLGVTDKNKDKVILYDAFGEKEYYPQTDLVRCKDCRFAMVRTEEEMNKPIKPQPILCEWFYIGVENNDYCSHGERREP